MVHTELGKRLLDRLADVLKDVGQVEQPAKLEGRNMTMVLAPRPDVKTGTGKQVQEAVKE